MEIYGHQGLLTWIFILMYLMNFELNNNVEQERFITYFRYNASKEILRISLKNIWKFMQLKSS